MAKKSAIIKRDYEKNWKKSSYIPDENVIIIMDYEDGSFGLMVGDGKTNVNLLPNLSMNKVVKNDTLIL